MVERTSRAGRSPLENAARLVSIVFILVGILGFIPGITEDAPGDFAGEDSPGSLLHIFQVGILHNIVHLLFGVVGLAMARTWEGSRRFLVGGGAVYLVLWLLGLAGALDWLPADVSDHWLHFVLGIGMVGLGLLLGRRTDDRRDDYASTARA